MEQAFSPLELFNTTSTLSRLLPKTTNTMYLKSISPAATLLLFSTLARVGDCTIKEGDLVIAAMSRLGPAATSFCSSFLGIPKHTVTATITPIVVATATITILTMIRVDKRTAATPTAPECPIFGLPCLKPKRNINRPIPGALLPFKETLISIACSLLHITPAATTITATRAPTTTTTTVTTTATITVKRGNCDPDASHDVTGNGGGNTIYITSETTALTCCQRCQAFLNCVANSFIEGKCQLLIKISRASGTNPSAMCPNGLDSYDFGPSVVGKLVFKGPCGR